MYYIHMYYIYMYYIHMFAEATYIRMYVIVFSQKNEVRKNRQPLERELLYGFFGLWSSSIYAQKVVEVQLGTVRQSENSF
jgi:hypothetical protein